MSTILPAVWPLAPPVLYKTYVRLNKWTLRDNKTATRGWTLVRACVLMVLMSIIVPLLLITCMVAGLSRTVSGRVVALAMLLVLP